MGKLAIISTHPIQYNAPLYKKIGEVMDLEVLYCMDPTPAQVGKDGFGAEVKWDVDLLSGYQYRFLDNVAATPSVSTYAGCDVPDIGGVLKEIGATHVMVSGWNVKAYLQAIRYCNKQGIKVAVRGDSQLSPQTSGLKKLVKKFTYPAMLRKFDRIFYVGERNKAYLKHYKYPEDQLLWSPHAVDQEFWSQERDDVNLDFRNELPSFLWVGKMIHKKRPIDMVNAFRRYVEEGNAGELIMVGTGPLLDRVQNAATGLDVRFEGFKNQTELIPYYKQADCLVLSSDYGETWGLVVNEGFANGLPAIVSNAAGCSQDLIDQGKTGYMFNLGDIAGLVEAMKHIKSNTRELYADAISAKNSAYAYSSSLPSFLKFLET